MIAKVIVKIKLGNLHGSQKLVGLLSIVIGAGEIIYHGTIIEFHLTKTILLNDDGRKIYIPNHKFNEEAKIIYPKQKSLAQKSMLTFIGK